MGWLYLIIAGIFEVVWAIALKYSEGFTKLLPSVITVIGLIISMYFLSITVKLLPIGTAYTVWTGIGAFGTALLGMLLFNESKELPRIICLIFIISGIIGLKIFSK